MKLQKKDVLQIIEFFILKILMDYAYSHIIAVEYRYLGFLDNRSIITNIISWMILLYFLVLINTMLNRDSERFSSTVVFLLSLCSIVPFCTLFSYGMVKSIPGCLFFIYWTCLIIFQRRFEHKNLNPIRIKIGTITINDRVAIIIGVLSMFLVLYISFRYTHFRLNFNLFNVYDLRNEASNYNLPIIIDYAFCWSRPLNNVLLAYALSKKKYGLALLFFITQMFSFGIDGLKSTFFMPFIVLLFVIFYKKGSMAKYKNLFVMAISGITAMGCLEFVIFKTSYIVTIIIRRVFIIPVYLGTCYADFFIKNTPDYFRSSVLRHFGFTTPYKNLGEIIGGQYFGNSSINCNNGMLADAMANFGIAGVIIMPIMLLLVLRFLDDCTESLDEKIFLPMAIYTAILMMNSFLLTILMTHGLLITGIVLYMMREKNKSYTCKL